MASPNSLVLHVASWIDPQEWRNAPDFLRQRLIRRACELAKMAKLRQVAAGIGANGKKMAKRKRPRKDGATGAVLAPHWGQARSQKWVRAVPGFKNGTATLYWSHGWGTILGYHKEGLGRYGPIAKRNVIGFPKAAERRLINDVRHYWDGLLRNHGLKPLAPPKITLPAAPVLPAIPRIVPPPRPVAALPQPMFPARPFIPQVIEIPPPRTSFLGKLRAAAKRSVDAIARLTRRIWGRA